jgi:hypothetical protein
MNKITFYRYSGAINLFKKFLWIKFLFSSLNLSFSVNFLRIIYLPKIKFLKFSYASVNLCLYSIILRESSKNGLFIVFIIILIRKLDLIFKILYFILNRVHYQRFLKLILGFNALNECLHSIIVINTNKIRFYNLMD